MDTTFKYGEHSFDFAKLPPASQRKLIQGGFAHYLGSEQASKVSGYFKDNPEEDTAEARAKMKADLQAAAMAALLDGTVGEHSRGPAKDPLEAIMEGIAKRDINALLKANGLSFTKDPKATKEAPLPRIVTFANGSTRTMEEMVAKRLADHGETIKAEAQKELAAREKAAKKAAETAAKAPKAENPDALGL